MSSNILPPAELRALLEANELDKVVGSYPAGLAPAWQHTWQACVGILVEWQQFAARGAQPPEEVRFQAIFKLLALLSATEKASTAELKAQLSQQFEENISKGYGKVLEWRRLAAQGAPQAQPVLNALLNELAKYQRKYRNLRTGPPTAIPAIAVWAEALLDIDQFLEKLDQPPSPTPPSA